LPPINCVRKQAFLCQLPLWSIIIWGI
jgi:hypothetical protein